MISNRRTFSAADTERLIAAIDRAAGCWLTHVPHLDVFRSAVRRGRVVRPADVPADVITMNSRFAVENVNTGECATTPGLPGGRGDSAGQGVRAQPGRDGAARRPCRRGSVLDVDRRTRGRDGAAALPSARDGDARLRPFASACTEPGGRPEPQLKLKIETERSHADMLSEAIVSDADKERVIERIRQARSAWSTYAPLLDWFRAGLDDVQAVAPTEVPDDVITMNSRFAVMDLRVGRDDLLHAGLPGGRVAGARQAVRAEPDGHGAARRASATSSTGTARPAPAPPRCCGCCTSPRRRATATLCQSGAGRLSVLFRGPRVEKGA